MGAKELRIENIEWRINGKKPFSLKFSNSFIISKNDRIIKFQNIKKKSFKASKLPSFFKIMRDSARAEGFDS